MGEILAGLDRVLYYLDDIIVFGSSPADHQDKLRDVPNSSRSCPGVQLNDSKCHYGQSQISFLGHIMNKDGVILDN